MPCTNHPDVLTGLATCTRCGRDFCPDCIITLKGAVVCGGCKGDVVQDVKSGTVPGELALAGRGARLVAMIIDQFIIVLIMVVIFTIVGVAMAMSMGHDVAKTLGGSLGSVIMTTYFITV